MALVRSMLFEFLERDGSGQKPEWQKNHNLIYALMQANTNNCSYHLRAPYLVIRIQLGNGRSCLKSVQSKSTSLTKIIHQNVFD